MSLTQSQAEQLSNAVESYSANLAEHTKTGVGLTQFLRETLDFDPGEEEIMYAELQADKARADRGYAPPVGSAKPERPAPGIELAE